MEPLRLCCSSNRQGENGALPHSRPPLSFGNRQLRLRRRLPRHGSGHSQAVTLERREIPASPHRRPYPGPVLYRGDYARLARQALTGHRLPSASTRRDRRHRPLSARPPRRPLAGPQRSEKIRARSRTAQSCTAPHGSIVSCIASIRAARASLQRPTQAHPLRSKSARCPPASHEPENGRTRSPATHLRIGLTARRISRPHDGRAAKMSPTVVEETRDSPQNMATRPRPRFLGYRQARAVLRGNSPAEAIAGNRSAHRTTPSVSSPGSPEPDVRCSGLGHDPPRCPGHELVNRFL